MQEAVIEAGLSPLAGATAELRERGIIRGWRGELYPVLESFHQAPLALLERAAAPHFGIKVGLLSRMPLNSDEC